MIKSPTPTQAPIAFGGHNTNISKDYSHLRVLNLETQEKVWGLTSKPLLVWQNAVPSCQLKIKTWELTSKPLLSRVTEHSPVPKKTLIYKYISEPLRLLTNILNIILRAWWILLRKNYRVQNNDNNNFSLIQSFSLAATTKKYLVGGSYSRNYSSSSNQHVTTAQTTKHTQRTLEQIDVSDASSNSSSKVIKNFVLISRLSTSSKSYGALPQTEIPPGSSQEYNTFLPREYCELHLSHFGASLRPGGIYFLPY